MYKLSFVGFAALADIMLYQPIRRSTSWTLLRLWIKQLVLCVKGKELCRHLGHARLSLTLHCILGLQSLKFVINPCTCTVHPTRSDFNCSNEKMKQNRYWEIITIAHAIFKFLHTHTLYYTKISFFLIPWNHFELHTQLPWPTAASYRLTGGRVVFARYCTGGWLLVIHIQRTLQCACMWSWIHSRYR